MNEDITKESHDNNQGFETEDDIDKDIEKNDKKSPSIEMSKTTKKKHGLVIKGIINDFTRKKLTYVIAQKLSSNSKTIYLDTRHGGRDTSANGNGLKKDLTLDIALRTRK